MYWLQDPIRRMLLQTNPLYAVLFSFVFLLLAGSSLVKDMIFQEGKKNLDGRKLDLVSFNHNKQQHNIKTTSLLSQI